MIKESNLLGLHLDQFLSTPSAECTCIFLPCLHHLLNAPASFTVTPLHLPEYHSLHDLVHHLVQKCACLTKSSLRSMGLVLGFTHPGGH